MLSSLIQRLIELARREHYNCEEDTWYGCPLSRDGCSNDSIPKKCNCGADAHNAEVDAIVIQINDQIKKMNKNKTKWLDINTAPKDGRPVWTRGRDWGEKNGKFHYGWAFFKNGSWYWGGDIDGGNGKATFLTDWFSME